MNNDVGGAKDNIRNRLDVQTPEHIQELIPSSTRELLRRNDASPTSTLDLNEREGIMSVDSQSSSSETSLSEQLVVIAEDESTRLYNREGDLRQLYIAYKKRHLRHLVLSVGPPGVGKTILIRRLRPRVEKDGGFFVEGRFDDLDNPEPFAAWVDAAEQLIEQFIDRCDEVELAIIMKAINQFMEVSDLHALATMMPLLGDLMNLTPQPPTGRFQFSVAFGAFLRAVAHPERPIVWFLDHVHAADASSLEILKLLLADQRIPNILPVLAFRPVPPLHPTSNFLQTLEAAKIPLVPIVPTPIDEISLLEWLDSYRMGLTVDQRAQICTTIAEGLQGNALAIHLCLEIMNANQEIVRATGGTPIQPGGDCISLFQLKIQMLATESQQLCRTASCMGTRIDLPHLSEIITNCDIPKALAEAERHKILRFIYDSDYPLEHKKGLGELHALDCGYYEFVIPSYREFLYATLSPEQRQVQHTAIGTVLRQGKVDIYRVVVHMALAGDHLAPKAKELLVGYCVEAGRRATHCGEWVVAAKYYQLGISLLVDCRGKFWNTQASLIMDLYCDTAEVAGLLGKYAEMDALIEEAMNQAKDAAHRFQATQIQLQGLIAQQKYSDAMAVGLKALQRNGESIKKNTEADLKAIRKLIQTEGEDSLLNRPVMMDPKALGVMQVMNLLVSPALLLQDDLIPSLACRMVKHSLQHGLAPSSPFAMCLLGIVLCLVGDIDLGVRCSDTGMEWVETIQDKAWKGRVMTIHWGLVSRFVKPWRICQEPLKVAYRTCIQNGDSEFSLICPVISVLNMIAAGGPLPPIAQAMKSVYQLLQRKKHESLQRLLRPFYQLVLNLMGVSPEVDPLVLTGTIMNEDEEWRQIRENANPTMEICLLWCQSSVAFHLHKFIKARQLLEQCQALYHRVPHVVLGSFQILIEFWNALTAVRLLWKYRRAESLSITDKKYQTELESSVKMSLVTLTTLAKYATDNVHPKVLLLQGEMAALQGNHEECMEHFQRALESAEEGLLDKALIGEQVGLTLRLCGKEDLALDYLEDCCASYRAWGALIKVNHVKGTVIPEAIYEWEE